MSARRAVAVALGAKVFLALRRAASHCLHSSIKITRLARSCCFIGSICARFSLGVVRRRHDRRRATEISVHHDLWRLLPVRICEQSALFHTVWYLALPLVPKSAFFIFILILILQLICFVSSSLFSCLYCLRR